MNNFFCNVGKILHDKLIANNDDQPDFDTSLSIDNSMFLWNTGEGEIIFKIMSLKNSHTLKDSISSNILKKMRT